MEQHGEVLAELNVAVLIEYVVIYELLMERYKETELFKYMVQQIKPDAVMLLNGTELDAVVKVLQKKLARPAIVNLIDEIRKLPHKQMES